VFAVVEEKSRIAEEHSVAQALIWVCQMQLPQTPWYGLALISGGRLVWELFGWLPTR